MPWYQRSVLARYIYGHVSQLTYFTSFLSKGSCICCASWTMEATRLLSMALLLLAMLSSVAPSLQE
jgi:hypothetical protein